MTDLLTGTWESQRSLVIATLVFALGSAVLAAMMLFDDTQILGINRWIKPIKFFSSAAIFTGTVALFLHLLQANATLKQIISWGVIAAMAIELILITMQAARGITSHFNTSTPFDAGVFSVMGLVIGINTVLVLLLGILYFTGETELPAGVLWGIRLGIFVFLLGSIQGGYMSSQVGHAVGVPDGGAGLPFVNWSTEGGDLRVAHFLGLHALQVIPLFALGLGYLLREAKVRVALVILFALLYTAGFTALWLGAVQGKPLIRNTTYEQGND